MLSPSLRVITRNLRCKFVPFRCSFNKSSTLLSSIPQFSCIRRVISTASVVAKQKDNSYSTWYGELNKELVDKTRKVNITKIWVDGTCTKQAQSFDEFLPGELKYRDWELLSAVEITGRLPRPDIIEPRPYNNSIIFCTEKLRALLRQDSVTFFHASDLNSYFIDGFEMYIRDLNIIDSKDRPLFELWVLEGLLKYVVTKQSRRLALYQVIAREVVFKFAKPKYSLLSFGREIESDIDQRKLLLIQSNIDSFISRLGNLKNMIGDENNFRSDIDSMILSSEANKDAQKLEVEMLIEISSSRMSRLRSDARWLRGILSNYFEVSALKLDQERNMLMRASLHLSMGTVALTSFACLASVFGMNLTHGYEDHPTAFIDVLTIGGSSSVVAFGALFGLYWRSVKKLARQRSKAYNSLRHVLRDIPLVEDILSSGSEKLSRSELEKMLAERNRNMGMDNISEFSDENLNNEVDLIFSIMDTSKDGYLDHSEYKEVLRSIDFLGEDRSARLIKRNR